MNRERIAAVAVTLTTLAFAAALLLIHDPELAQTVSNVGLTIVPLAAAIACVVRSRHQAGRLRLAWALLGAYAASWGVGQAIWTWYESFLGRDVPFPSAADVGYLLAVPFAVAGLLVLTTAPKQLAGLLRTVLDGLVAACSLLLISWVLVLGPVVRASADDLVPKLISIAYPVGDVITITILVFAFGRFRYGSRIRLQTLTLLCLGLLAFAVADSGFAYLALDASYSSGNLIDVGWFAGYALVLLAACLAPRAERAPDAGEPDSPRTVLWPYIPVVLAAVTVGIKQISRGLDALIVWGLLALLLLVVARQVLTLLENVSLTHNLEERVRVRTAELRHSEERFRSLVQNSTDVITILEENGTIRYTSPASSRVFGYDPDSLLGTGILDLVDEIDRYRLGELLNQAAIAIPGSLTIELRLCHASGHVCQTETTITNLLEDASVGGLVLNTRDVSERKELESELTHQAFHDTLTGLANRALFKDRVEHALEQTRRQWRPLAVLFVDLDGFKGFNDSLGHAAGDELLVAVADRLSASVRPQDTVARLGGDEFGILLEDVAGEPEVMAAAERITTILTEPLMIHDRELIVVGSIGIAIAENGRESAEDLLRNADLAMYRAKAQGVGTFERYRPEMHDGVLQRLELESDLRLALLHDQLEVHYQPIVDLRTGKVGGVEALVRWNHPTRGLVPPGAFIPIAEANGQIVPIGAWVLQTACEETRRLSETLGTPMGVSVNLSGRQFARGDLADIVKRTLSSTGFPAANLILELTESMLMEGTESTLATLDELRRCGVRVAIDDFGTGYSSLSYLHRFPVDILKIDRSFVSRLGQTDRADGLAASIIRIGEGLNLETVAEGIEEEGQLDALVAMGCEQGQGFLFAHPLRSDGLRQLLLDRLNIIRRATPV